MKISRILIGSATMALGTMLAWGAAPAMNPAPTSSAPFALAQGRRQMAPADMAKMQTDRLDQAVKLTADQKTKVEAIYEKAATDSAAARQSGDMASVREINTKAQDEIKALLTPEQVKKFPAGRGGRRGGPGGPGGGMGNMGGGGMGN